MTPYTLHLNKSTFNIVRKLVAIVVLIAFFATSVNTSVFGSTPLTTGAQPSQQALLPWMPQPGVRISLSPEYTPAHLQGMVIHPENALLFDFIINRGDQELAESQKEQEYKKLVKYFLASLAIPDDNQWVNLSPYEKDRIIKDDFGKTEMGRDLLSQDYILKQITASMIYPESNLGQKFWEKVYSQAYQQFGKTTVPVNTFNKVWIIPDEAVVYEHGNTVYVLKNHLKVMLEEDYLSLDKHSGISNTGTAAKNVNKLGSEVVREIVLPALEKEVNEGKNFAALRQVYSAMILAAWYKRVLKESLLGKIYLDRSKIKGVDQQDSQANQRIYQQYLTAFKKGVFNYIKEDVDRYTKEPIPRKYFSGGAIGGKAYQSRPGNSGLQVQKSLTPEQEVAVGGDATRSDMAMVNLKELLEVAKALGIESPVVHDLSTPEGRYQATVSMARRMALDALDEGATYFPKSPSGGERRVIREVLNGIKICRGKLREAETEVSIQLALTELRNLYAALLPERQRLEPITATDSSWLEGRWIGTTKSQISQFFTARENNLRTQGARRDASRAMVATRAEFIAANKTASVLAFERSLDALGLKLTPG